MPHRIAPKIIIVVLGVSVLALALILLAPSSAPAVPSISWTPESVTQTILAGESATVPVSFTATENLTNVVVRVVPELAPYVQTNPTSFASIAKGQTVSINVAFSAPASSLPGTFNGTIQLRSGVGAQKSFAKPLAVKVEVVWQRVVEVTSGVSFVIPPTWAATQDGEHIDIAERFTQKGTHPLFQVVVTEFSMTPDTSPIEEILTSIVHKKIGSDLIQVVGFHDNGIEVEATTIFFRHVFLYDKNSNSIIEFRGGTPGFFSSPIFLKILSSIS